MATDKMNRTWLIQRLTVPHPDERTTAPTNTYRDAMRAGGEAPAWAAVMRRGVFGLDYMGSAEFEFGAIAKALRAMAEAAGDFTTHTVTIPRAEIAVQRRSRRGAPRDGTAYLLARPGHMEHAEEIVRAAARNERLDMKESTRLADAFNPERADEARIGGWLELDNLFWFFTDKAMFDGVCALYGIAP